MKEKEGEWRGPWGRNVGQSNSFFRPILKKKMSFYPLNRLQPVIVAFLTIINKFSDTGRHKVNLVAFVENLQSLVAFVSKYSTKNLIDLNPNKSRLMIFSYNNYVDHVSLVSF